MVADMSCRQIKENDATDDAVKTQHRFSDISKIYVGSTAQTTDICYRNVGGLQSQQHVGI
jgi:hypothetical protein